MRFFLKSELEAGTLPLLFHFVGQGKAHGKTQKQGMEIFLFLQWEELQSCVAKGINKGKVEELRPKV